MAMEGGSVDLAPYLLTRKDFLQITQIMTKFV